MESIFNTALIDAKFMKVYDTNQLKVIYFVRKPSFSEAHPPLNHDIVDVELIPLKIIAKFQIQC